MSVLFAYITHENPFGHPPIASIKTNFLIRNQRRHSSGSPHMSTWWIMSESATVVERGGAKDNSLFIHQGIKERDDNKEEE